MTSSRDEISTREFIQRLLDPVRAERIDTFAVLTYSGISDRDTVGEIGCGPGYFTIPLAKTLYNGKVYALDIDDEMLAACRQRVSEARMGNVEILKCDEFDFPLKEGSMDGLFLAFVVQHSPDKPRFLGAARELLRRRGWCTILEWYRKETETGPPVERRVDPGNLRQIAEDAGFRHLNWRDLNGEQYIMTLRNQ
jgi:SAM-dependent methyltransferase